jgi:hypothetical protein
LGDGEELLTGKRAPEDCALLDCIEIFHIDANANFPFALNFAGPQSDWLFRNRRKCGAEFCIAVAVNQLKRVVIAESFDEQLCGNFSPYRLPKAAPVGNRCNRDRFQVRGNAAPGKRIAPTENNHCTRKQT